ncbi:MAG: hypothetical protein ABIH27_05765 [Candidatus Omnitrophota bacterium]
MKAYPILFLSLSVVVFCFWGGKFAFAQNQDSEVLIAEIKSSVRMERGAIKNLSKRYQSILRKKKLIESSVEKEKRKLAQFKRAALEKERGLITKEYIKEKKKAWAKKTPKIKENKAALEEQKPALRKIKQQQDRVQLKRQPKGKGYALEEIRKQHQFQRGAVIERLKYYESVRKNY